MLVEHWHPEYIGPGVLPTSEIFLGTASRFAVNHLYYCKRIGDYQCSDAYMVDRRSPEKRREIYHIFFVLSGQLQVEYRGHAFAASQGAVVVLDCRQEHRYYCTDHVNFLWLDIDGSATAAYIKLLTQRQVPMYYPSGFGACTNRILTIARETEDNSGNEHLNSSFWHSMFSELAVDAERGTANLQTCAADLAMQYIQQNFAEKLTVEELASRCGVSVYHFIRLFKRSQNCTPHEYIMGVRLRQGVRLLLTTDMTVGEIAISVGFHSASHFSSCFKSHYGMTPREYRTCQPAL